MHEEALAIAYDMLAQAGPFASFIDAAIAADDLLPVERRYKLTKANPAQRLFIASYRLRLLRLGPTRIRRSPEEKIVQRLAIALEEFKQQEAARAEASRKHVDARTRAERGMRTRGGGFAQHLPRILCLECRRVNAHGSGCSRDLDVRVALPIAARPPRHDASNGRWKQFFHAVGTHLGGREIAPLLAVFGFKKD